MIKYLINRTRTDNSETLATRHRTKTNKAQKTQHDTENLPKKCGESRCSRRV